MKAALYQKFGGEVSIQSIPDPKPTPEGLVVEVKATGICRSDWYGWQGNDSDIELPHVPGHELAGIVVDVGKTVKRWKKGDRVTVPFVGGCGSCPECQSGHHQVCDQQFQPGFTAYGSFAEYVAIDYADVNIVRLPETMDFITAASLGCRFITAFRGVVDLGKLEKDQWIAIHGCGGVGISAILIARALGANIIAVDIDDEVLAFAKSCGADYTINSLHQNDVPQTIIDITSRGAHVSIDALGHHQTCQNSILSLKKRGKHIQIGLLEKGETDVAIPMDRIIAHELQILGSHGMQAHRYPAIWKYIEDGLIDPGKLVTDVVNLSEGINILTHMDTAPPRGVAVINNFN